MNSRKRLRGGLVRVLPDHRTALGKELRREFRAIVAGLGINGDSWLQADASRVAFLSGRAREAARVWGVLVEKRRVGRGRRPSPQAVERAARRAALDDETYTAGLDRLRELAGQRKTRPTLAEVLAQQAEDAATPAEQAGG